MLTKPDWTETPLEEKKRMIREMIALEMTAEKISKAFENCTRNAVIGFCRRHNIKLVGPRPRDPKPKNKRRTPPPRPIGNTASRPVRETEFTPDPTAAVPFIEAIDKKLCKWPLWSRDEVIGDCCGMPRAEGSSYCEFHVELATRTPMPSEEKAVKALEAHAS